MSLEDRLRRSLQARAEDVSPDPAMFSVVQSRIRRARTFRLALAGVAATLAVAGVAIAAPNLIDRRIELEPGPVATQPGEDPAPTESTGGALDGGMVFTDGEAVFSFLEGVETEIRASGCPAGSDCDIEPVRHVAIWMDPGTQAHRSIAARGCAGLEWTTGGESLMADTCPTSVVFSPDGRHLAWVGQADPDGQWMLHTVDLTEEGLGDDDASFGLELDEATDVRLEDWTWDRNEADVAEGGLYLQVTGSDRTEILRRRIERQADGAIALPASALDGDFGPYRPLGAMPDFMPVAFAAGRTGFDEMTLEIHTRDDAIDFGHIHLAGEYRDLPDAVIDGIADAEPEDLWLTSSGTEVVIGDGSGEAWTAPLDDDDAPFVQLPIEAVHADLARSAEVPASEPPAEATTSQVDVYFGMTGADACVADQAVEREVEGPGVARGALTELLKGPSSRESNEGIVSPFNANTAGALRDITIVDGQARVDFSDFSADVERDSCTKSAIVDSLNKTLFQFPTVESTLYSFDGDTEAWEEWLGLHSDALTPPDPVVDTQKAIYDAAVNRSWKTLRRLSAETSCTMSDQPEPCVPYWKDQEANGADPLGTMVDLLSGGAAKNPNAPIWVYPPEWADPDSGYSGPRIGIDEDGVWRYFVLEGG